MHFTRIKQWFTGQFIGEGKAVSWGWGFSWRCAESYGYISHPIGINWIAGMIRNTYWCIARGLKPSTREKELQDFYDQGYEDGFNAGEHSVVIQLSKQIREYLRVRDAE